jgi:hypothetical protein
MKKISVALIFAFVAMVGSLPMVTEARAESMNFKLVSMIEKVERVKVTQMEKVIIGVLDRKGLSIFKNGEIATTSCRGTFDSKKGFQGYSSMVFKDGSTLVLAWKGPTSQSRPDGGKFWKYSMTAEYVNGTGRFEGIKGSGTFTGMAPQWDKDYKMKGFTYYEFSGNYTLPK